jgi:hypothetical protein
VEASPAATKLVNPVTTISKIWESTSDLLATKSWAATSPAPSGAEMSTSRKLALNAAGPMKALHSPPIKIVCQCLYSGGARISLEISWLAS